MPKTKTQKQAMVQELTDKLSQAKSVVFTNYQGLTMSQLSQIRTDLRPQNAQLLVTKNNLLEIALEQAQRKDVDASVLKGPLATLFSFEDEIAPIKIVTKAFKDNNLGEVKGGLLGGEFLAAAKVNQLASLPSKDELRAKVVGTLGAPLYGIVGVLQANLRNLVYVLSAIKDQKGVSN